MKNFTILEKKLLIFLKIKLKLCLMLATEENRREQRAAGLKILTPKQMLQIFPIALAQVIAGNDS